MHNCLKPLWQAPHDYCCESVNSQAEKPTNTLPPGGELNTSASGSQTQVHSLWMDDWIKS